MDGTYERASMEQCIMKLKRSRSAKKGSITKRVTQLSRLVSEGSSRTKISYLVSALKEVHTATKLICEDLSKLCADDDEEWIEVVNLSVDSCIAEIQEYLEARKDDPPSTAPSYTETWVRDHTPDSVSSVSESLLPTYHLGDRVSGDGGARLRQPFGCFTSAEEKNLLVPLQKQQAFPLTNSLQPSQPATLSNTLALSSTTNPLLLASVPLSSCSSMLPLQEVIAPSTMSSQVRRSGRGRGRGLNLRREAADCLTPSLKPAWSGRAATGGITTSSMHYALSSCQVPRSNFLSTSTADCTMSSQQRIPNTSLSYSGLFPVPEMPIHTTAPPMMDQQLRIHAPSLRDPRMSLSQTQIYTSATNPSTMKSRLQWSSSSLTHTSILPAQTHLPEQPLMINPVMNSQLQASGASRSHSPMWPSQATMHAATITPSMMSAQPQVPVTFTNPANLPSAPQILAPMTGPSMMNLQHNVPAQMMMSSQPRVPVTFTNPANLPSAPQVMASMTGPSMTNLQHNVPAQMSMPSQTYPPQDSAVPKSLPHPHPEPFQWQEKGNQVDSWIDDLDCHNAYQAPPGITPEMTMAWMVQQSLPRVQIPVFDGAPTSWVEFIMKFKDLVHDQHYLNDLQKGTYLIQHLSGEAKRSIQGFTNDRRGYILSLKRLKFMFGQRSQIAQATLQRITRGRSVANDDREGLVEFYYTISDCLTTLKLLNYASDLYSSDILRQAVRRLPNQLHLKWAEHSLRIRQKNEEPSLLHLESWLQWRILALKESYLPMQGSGKASDGRNLGRNRDSQEKIVGATQTKDVTCNICKENHRLWKCGKYLKMVPSARFESVRKMELCHNCLSGGHSTPDCKSRNTCFVARCNLKHHTTLHKHFVPVKKEDGVENQRSATKEDERSGFNGMVHATEPEVYLQVVPVTLIGPNGKSLHTYALLDGGSHSTLIRGDVARRLSLRGTSRNITIATIKDKGEQLRVNDVSLEVASRDGSERLTVNSAFVVPPDKFNMPSQPLPADYNESDLYTHLDGIDLVAVAPSDISILLGANVPEALIPTEVRRGNHYQPLAIRTKFGWTLFGTSAGTKSSTGSYMCNLIHAKTGREIEKTLEGFWNEERLQEVRCNLVALSDDDSLQSSLESFWMQENYALCSERDIAMSKQDEDALKRLEEESKMVEGRYEVPMLWKSADVSLPNNYPQARKRLEFLLKRLRTDQALQGRYKDTISLYLEKGYARKMTRQEAKVTTARTWYLPHHPVFNPNKPNKVRVVFDAAASVEGKSLNQSLITGPDLLNTLVGVLLRFRLRPVAIVADVEAMYHQVKVPIADADSLRFLWKEDIHSDEHPQTFQMMVHIFGAKDSQTCATYALKAVARDHHQPFSGGTYESVLRAFYVDDILQSVASEEAAVELAQELIELLKCGGFKLTKFFSNNRRVIESLPTEVVSPKMSFDLNTENIEKTLGISWNSSRDIFIFASNIKEPPSTKRSILRVVSSIFDPLGFLTPYTLSAKLILQELWRTNHGWDEEISEEFSAYWKKWLNNLGKVSSIEINRCTNQSNQLVSDLQLHVFADASERAYGAVAYLRLTFKEGGHLCCLLMSKSKLAPIKTITLPRLELNAAVSAVRLYRILIQEIDLPIEKTYFWVDSTLTLQYVRNETQRFKIYVANRVTEIREQTQKEQWSYVPTKQNPADRLTRGNTDPSKLMESDKLGNSWFNGPAFLKNDENDWPSQPDIKHLCEYNPEIKRNDILIAATITRYNLVDMTRFSKWTRLKRATAWVFRFINNCQAKGKQNGLLKETLTHGEVEIGESFIIKQLQRDVFHDEISILHSNGALPARNKLSSLSPFVDQDGILRVGGRLRHAPIPDKAKHPYLLPKDHHVTDLIINDEHERSGHVGAEHVLSSLRQYCWVVSGRTTVKRVIRKCFRCRIRRAKRLYPFMSDLPKGRVAFEEPPFTNCGVDLFGPLFIKQGRKRLKRWGVLFTCLTVRCIHLEVVESLETDSLINTLRRFVNRRGSPKIFYSDCGTNFVGAPKELKIAVAAINHQEIDKYTESNGIKWCFNPPAAPHMGGVWERLVRSVKEVMTGLMMNQVLTDPQLVTLFTEVESILNTRPITHASDDVNDLEALTPNHILLGKHRNWHLVADINSKDMSSRKKWRQVQAHSNEFWNRWKREYLPTITKRTSMKVKTPNHKVGELVVVDDDTMSKGHWKLGRITKVMSGDDDVVRVAEVRTKDGTYVRPAAKLLRLEENIEVPQEGGDVGVNQPL